MKLILILLVFTPLVSESSPVKVKPNEKFHTRPVNSNVVPDGVLICGNTHLTTAREDGCIVTSFDENPMFPSSQSKKYSYREFLTLKKGPKARFLGVYPGDRLLNIMHIYYADN